jgi:hypothetical protein
VLPLVVVMLLLVVARPQQLQRQAMAAVLVALSSMRQRRSMGAAVLQTAEARPSDDFETRVTFDSFCNIYGRPFSNVHSLNSHLIYATSKPPTKAAASKVAEISQRKKVTVNTQPLSPLREAPG